MTEAEFVASSIAHQLGDGTGRWVAEAETRAFAFAAGSGSTLGWNAAEARPYPDNGWRLEGGELRPGHRSVNPAKAEGTLRQLLAAGADFDLLIDMQDRRMRNLVLPDGRLHPVVSFNRLGDATGRVLWPLPGYQDLGSPEFLGDLDPAAVPWAQKLDRFAWRGIHGGRENPKGDARREGKRLRPLLRAHAAGAIGAAEIEARLNTFPRHRFVARYADDPRADVGFVDGNGFTLAEEPMLAPLARPRVTRAAFQHFRYLVVLRGLDIGSSFFWTMNSGSLGLVMETPFQSFASVHFRPFEHYVPFREDLADFEDRLAWCHDHPAECQEMVRRAGAVCRLLDRADLRAAVLGGVVDGMRARLS